jgi:hypothetical protein
LSAFTGRSAIKNPLTYRGIARSNTKNFRRVGLGSLIDSLLLLVTFGEEKIVSSAWVYVGFDDDLSEGAIESCHSPGVSMVRRRTGNLFPSPERTDASQSILGPSAPATACQFPKNGRDVIVCLDYQKTHNLCPIRGDSYDEHFMTSPLTSASVVRGRHPCCSHNTLAQHGDVPDRHPPRSMST